MIVQQELTAYGSLLTRVIPDIKENTKPISFNTTKIRPKDIIIAATDGLTDLISPILLNRLALRAYETAQKKRLDHAKTAELIRDTLIKAAKIRLTQIIEGKTQQTKVKDNLTIVVHVHNPVPKSDFYDNFIL